MPVGQRSTRDERNSKINKTVYFVLTLNFINFQKMLPAYEKIKGIHPGAILKRELKKRKIKSNALAQAVSEYPQTINAITKERRGITPQLSIKLGNFFNVTEDYFMLLQASYEVTKTLRQQQRQPLKGKFRKQLFWDTDFDTINAEQHKHFIIQRILERGNDTDIKSLIDYYGVAEIEHIIHTIKGSFIPAYKENIKKHFSQNII